MFIREFNAEIQAFENEASLLRNIYWRIRATRSVNRQRKWYRQAAKEKARLAGLGFDPEVIRLYALSLKDTRREQRRQRFEEEFHAAKERPPRPPKPVQLTLF